MFHNTELLAFFGKKFISIKTQLLVFCCAKYKYFFHFFCIFRNCLLFIYKRTTDKPPFIPPKGGKIKCPFKGGELPSPQ